MPLRFVEAATRDDAIAAAREQFGATARVVGVRRVRSGGVLGFFATERYVAEVDPEPAARPAVPVPPPSRASGERRPPRDDAARPAVPARNGAAAYAETGATPSAARPARRGPRDDDARVDELAGLLGPSAPAAFPRTSVRSAAVAAVRDPEPVPVRSAVVRTAARPAAVRPAWSDILAGTAVAAPAPAAPAADPQPPGSAASPSPFTAALARMVAGDHDVRLAVEDALAAPRDASTAMPDSEPTWSGPLATAETTVPPSVAHREEEPVELQDWTSSSTSFEVPAVPPAWGIAEPAAPAAVSREEAIAEVLRAALDEGRSDEALAGILRRVMDGASTASALPETPSIPEPAAEEPVTEPTVVEPEAADAPVPVAAGPVAVEWSSSAPPASAWDLAWSDSDSSPLWADASPTAGATRLGVEATPGAGTRIEPPQEAPAEAQETVLDAPVAAAVVDEFVAEEPVAEEPVAEEPVAEEPVAEEPAQAPVLARTASDPAPLSLDATSVMPPLSLLPPLPSARRGGRPPVPPSMHRPASARPATGHSAPAPGSEPSPAPSRFGALATVTRLPLVTPDPTPVPAVEDIAAEAPPVAAPDVETPVTGRPAAVMPVVDEPAVERPAEQTAVLPPVLVEPTAPRPEPAPGDPVSRLAALGLPEDLLDAEFGADAAVRGTYAALTRALAARLPETPELPDGAGEVLVVVGPGVETLRAARALAATLRLDTDRVRWATRGDLAGLAPEGSRMATVEAALERRQEAIGSGTLTIVAVDAPLRTDAYWTAQMLAIWAPAAVWAVVEATRKPEDLGPWVEGLPRVDALLVQDTDLSLDPAAVLTRVALPLDLPVAAVDGMRATPHRWASLLCERLESSAE